MHVRQSTQYDRVEGNAQLHHFGHITRQNAVSGGHPCVRSDDTIVLAGDSHTRPTCPTQTRNIPNTCVIHLQHVQPQ